MADDDLAKMITALEISIKEMEQTLGSDHVQISYKLDRYAALLRKEKRLLEAVNAEARAKVIRAKHLRHEDPVRETGTELKKTSIGQKQCRSCRFPIAVDAVICTHCKRLQPVKLEKSVTFIIAGLGAMLVLKLLNHFTNANVGALVDLELVLPALFIVGAAWFAYKTVGVVCAIGAMSVVLVVERLAASLPLPPGTPGLLLALAVAILLARTGGKRRSFQTFLAGVGLVCAVGAVASPFAMAAALAPLAVATALTAYSLGDRKLSLVAVSIAGMVVMNLDSRFVTDGVSQAADGVSPASAASSIQDYKVINEENPGEQIVLDSFLIPNNYTVFEFFSPYCGPCHKMKPALMKLASQRDDVVVRAVDINRPDFSGIDFDSPVAEQYEVHAVPCFMVYGPDQRLVAQGEEAHAMVRQWVEGAGR